MPQPPPHSHLPPPHLPPQPPPHHQDQVPPPDRQPLGPPLKSLPYHQAAKVNKTKSLLLAVIFGTLLAIIIGFILNYFNLSINVIMPVLAPIWVGSITLIHSINSKI